jgi:hypothetical protein
MVVVYLRIENPPTHANDMQVLIREYNGGDCRDRANEHHQHTKRTKEESHALCPDYFGHPVAGFFFSSDFFTACSTFPFTIAKHKHRIDYRPNEFNCPASSS